jgi:flagellar hook-associated protein 1 FlgK
LWTQVSAVGFNSVQKTYLERIQNFHGAPDAELSVAAEVSRLYDAFSALSDSPEDRFLQAAAVNNAVTMANKVNSLSQLISTLRNDAQNEIKATVSRVNDLLDQVSQINLEIQSATNFGRSTAIMEDKRSDAISELSQLMDISFFKRGDGVLVVQTNLGVELASTKATHLTFNPKPLSATTAYPQSAAGVFVGDPTAPYSVDVTARSPGGKLGGLLELRDSTFPKQMAQLDELAHKMAVRMNAQGLRLFTDASGNIPGDTPPDPTTLPDPTPVQYVGFSNVIRVNAAILADNSLIQRGTAVTDEPVQPGSNEVIRRVLQYALGDVSHQQAVGTLDMRSMATGGVDLQNWLGIFSENTINAGVGMAVFPSVADMVALADGALDPPTEEFQITFEESRTGTGPFTITVNLSNANAQPGANALEQVVAEINAQIAAAGVPASLDANASVGSNGQLVLNSRGTVTIDAAFGPTGIQQEGLIFIGISGGTYVPEDPYFDVQVGSDASVRIYIEPGDTEADLINKLILNPNGDAFNPVGDTTGVPGLAYDEATFLATGQLILRAGDDFNNPAFGGDLRIIGGTFRSDPTQAASPDIAVLGAGNSVNIVSALFGSFSLGPPMQDLSPIIDVGYGSETNGALTPPIPTVAFRHNYLGPLANISTGVIGVGSLLDYAQKLVNEQTQEIVSLETRLADEQSLHDVLQVQLTNESGVNLDEELSHLIIVQTGYSAAARVVTAVDEMFRELLNAF